MCDDGDEKERRETWKRCCRAFASGCHERLGENSPIKGTSPFVISDICELTEPQERPTAFLFFLGETYQHWSLVEGWQKGTDGKFGEGMRVFQEEWNSSTMRYRPIDASDDWLWACTSEGVLKLPRFLMPQDWMLEFLRPRPDFVFLRQQASTVAAMRDRVAIGTPGKVVIAGADSGDIISTIGVTPNSMFLCGQDLLVFSQTSSVSVVRYSADSGKSKFLTSVTRGGSMECAMHVEPTGSRIAFADGASVKIADTGTGSRAIWSRSLKGEVTSVNFSPIDDRLVTTSCKDSHCAVWDTRTPEGPPVRVVEEQRDALWSHLCWDGDSLVTSANSRQAHLWDVGTGKLVAVIRNATGKKNCTKVMCAIDL